MIVGIIACCMVTNASAQEQEIAWVNGKAVSLDAFVQRYADFIASNGIKDNPMTRKAILRNMINEELLLRFDDNGSVEQNPAYLDALELAKKRVITAYLKDREIYANITASEAEVRQAFARANEKLAARHLYARTEEEALALYERIQRGETFEFLAKEVFTDSTLQANGGYLGYFSWGDMDPAFEDAAYSLRIGEISRPVQTAHGYSVIKLEDRLSHPLLTESEFLRKKSHLERVVKIRKKQPAEREYLKKLYDGQPVTLDDAQLSSLFEALHALPSSQSLIYSPVGQKSAGAEYTYDELFRRLSNLPDFQKERITSIERLKAAIKGLVMQDRLLDRSYQMGYDTVPAVQGAFAKTKDALLLKYKLQEITENSPLSDEDLAKYYHTNIHLFSSEDELNLQEIIVADKALADELKRAIEVGTDFGMLAEQHSARRWSAVNRGIIGLAPASKFGQLKGLLWQSPMEKLVGPIPIEGYYGLFKVLEKKRSEPLAFELVRGRVKQALQAERQRVTVQQYTDKLAQTAGVAINEQLLTGFRLSDYVSHESKASQ